MNFNILDFGMMHRRLLQINVCSAILSTGKITENIAKVIMEHGWDSYIAYGRMSAPSVSHEIKIGNKLAVYEHFFENQMFDNEGLASRWSTYQLIEKIKEIKPSIIHLHNLHDHYLNYPMLFKYLASINIPIVWTQHDCWSFTGGCTYFDTVKCEQWKSACTKCPIPRGLLIDKTKVHFQRKNKLISKIKNLTFITVSDWLNDLMRDSIHAQRTIVTIHNGIDVDKFRPVSKIYTTSKKFVVLGVAAVWDARKGLDDFIELRKKLPNTYEIILVGLKQMQIKNLPDGIKGISRTTNLDEMVALYSSADVFVNPTYSDNFPTTNLEALACGTPVITYNTGGSIEAVDQSTGFVVEQGNIQGLIDCILKVEISGKTSYVIPCRRRAEKLYDKSVCYKKYLSLYEKLL